MGRLGGVVNVVRIMNPIARMPDRIVKAVTFATVRAVVGVILVDEPRLLSLMRDVEAGVLVGDICAIAVVTTFLVAR